MSVESPTPPLSKIERDITRRIILGSAMGSLATLLLGSSEKQSERLPAHSLDVITPLRDMPESIRGASLELLNAQYISWLLKELEHEKGDAWTRIEATERSLRRVEGHGKPGSIGTALQIDESGIYLTAKHVVSDFQRPSEPTPYLTSIVDPRTGESAFAMDYALHPRADIALVSAPTGKPKKPTTGIQLNFLDIQQSERLVMVSLFPTQNYDSNLITEEGIVDRSIAFFDIKNADATYFAESEASLAVEGLIPRGGSSGGPIVNNRGVVVGVESGAYPSGARTIQNYKGARITPLGYARSISIE